MAARRADSVGSAAVDLRLARFIARTWSQSRNRGAIAMSRLKCNPNLARSAQPSRSREPPYSAGFHIELVLFVTAPPDMAKSRKME